MSDYYTPIRFTSVENGLQAKTSDLVCTERFVRKKTLFTVVVTSIVIFVILIVTSVIINISLAKRAGAPSLPEMIKDRFFGNKGSKAISLDEKGTSRPALREKFPPEKPKQPQPQQLVMKLGKPWPEDDSYSDLPEGFDPTVEPSLRSAILQEEEDQDLSAYDISTKLFQKK